MSHQGHRSKQERCYVQLPIRQTILLFPLESCWVHWNQKGKWRAYSSTPSDQHMEARCRSPTWVIQHMMMTVLKISSSPQGWFQKTNLGKAHKSSGWPWYCLWIWHRDDLLGSPAWGTWSWKASGNSQSGPPTWKSHFVSYFTKEACSL